MRKSRSYFFINILIILIFQVSAGAVINRQCLVHYSTHAQKHLEYFSKIKGSGFLEKRELGSFFVNAGIRTESEKIQFLENILMYDADKPSAFHLIGISGISESQTLNLAKKAARHFPSFLKYYIGYFELKSEASRYEVAKVLAIDNFKELIDGIPYFLIKNQDYLADLVLINLNSYQGNLSHFLLGFIRDYYKLNIVDIELNKKIAKIVLKKAPEAAQFLEKVFKIKSNDDLLEMFEYLSNFHPGAAYEFFPQGLSQENRWRILSTTLIKKNIFTGEFYLSIPELKAQLSTVVPADTLAMLWDNVQKYEVGLRLLEESYKYFNLSNREGLQRNLVPEKIASSIEVLRKSSGLEFSDQQIKELSSDTRGRLYELLLDIQNHIYFPFFREFEVSESLFHKKSFSKVVNYIEAVRSLLAISVENNDKKKASSEVLSYLKANNLTRINEQNIDSHVRLLKEETVKKAMGVLNDQSGIWNSENYNNLISRWGDLEPIWTLIARYNERGDKDGIYMLKKIIFHALKGTFAEYKFSGDNSDQQVARSQLSFLNNELRSLWIKPQVILRESIDSQMPSSELKLIASVKTSDPKLLLTVGDIVPTSSCQNYRTGTHIEALPGYVVDANVQALVSYELNQNSFEVKDFQVLRGWLKTGKISDFKIDFDGDQNQFVISNNGQIVKSRKLPRAYLRNIIKVGRTHLDEPIFFLEKSYLQNHPNIEQMKKQHQEILNSLNGRVFSAESDITVVRSRNPKGQYSDFHLDSMSNNDYTITVKQLQMANKQ